jgi:hypothetical protein
MLTIILTEAGRGELSGKISRAGGPERCQHNLKSGITFWQRNLVMAIQAILGASGFMEDTVRIIIGRTLLLMKTEFNSGLADIIGAKESAKNGVNSFFS